MEPDGDDGLASCWRMVENVEGVDELLEDLKNHTFAKKDAFTVGEVFNIGVEDLPDFIGENGHFSTIFDFSAHMLSDGEHGWYDAPPISFDAWKKQSQIPRCGYRMSGSRQISLKITMSRAAFPVFCRIMRKMRTGQRCLVQ